jgi:hypothetical protein
VPRDTSGLRRGGPGRPKGVPNKATREAKEFCASVVDDPDYQATIRRRAMRGQLAPAVECMLWYYAKGKPKEQLEHSGQQNIQISWIDDRLQAARQRLAKSDHRKEKHHSELRA